MSKKMKVAIIYDFDGTLCTGNMQDYALIPEFGMKPKQYWSKANKWGDDNHAEQVMSSMYYFVKKSQETGIDLTKEMFFRCGKNIEYFEGVEEWFDRINEYGKNLNLEIEHYIISAGYEEILEGTSIRHNFKEIFGCSFAYNEQGNPVWPARVVNYSTKTQYLSKINKGLGKLEDKAVNDFMPDEERPIPLSKMIYFGDGDTDVPSMRFVKRGGGYSFAVYQPKSHKRDRAIKLLKDDRVNFAFSADYREDKEIDITVKTILMKLATERDLQILQDKENKKKNEYIVKNNLNF